MTASGADTQRLTVCFVLLERMDRQMLIDHLKQAERHVAEGNRILGHQRSVVEHLRKDRRGGHLIDAAETLLRSFEEVQRMHVADMERLTRELAGRP